MSEGGYEPSTFGSTPVPWFAGLSSSLARSGINGGRGCRCMGGAVERERGPGGRRTRRMADRRILYYDSIASSSGRESGTSVFCLRRPHVESTESYT